MSKLIEESLWCPKCRLTWTPARIVEVYEETQMDSHGEYLVSCLVPSNSIRCVDCKQDYERPLTDEQRAVVATMIEDARAGAAKRRPALFNWAMTEGGK